MAGRMSGLLAIAWMALWTGACGAAPSGPAMPEAQTVCRSCRMSVADLALASQVVAPGRDPMFFDDFECLTGFLNHGTDVPLEFQVYVADHRTKEWAKADSAVFTRVEGLATPMGSGIVAHKDAASRDADPVSKGGVPIDRSQVVPVASRR